MVNKRDTVKKIVSPLDGKALARLAAMREAFRNIDDSDWQYLQQLLVRSTRHSQDAQTLIWRKVMKDVRAALAQTEAPSEATPAPADAGMREAFVRVLASLAAAISILERTPKAKKAVASDKMFDTMLDDYRKALEAGRTALTAPGATTKSDGGDQPPRVGLDWQLSDDAKARLAEIDAAIVRPGDPRLNQIIGGPSPIPFTGYGEYTPVTARGATTVPTLVDDPNSASGKRVEYQRPSDPSSTSSEATVEQQPPEWLWWGEVDGKDIVTFGRWPKRGARWRYKLAEIQPTEHDHPKRLPATRAVFEIILAALNYDGPDINSLTVGVINRARSKARAIAAMVK